MACSSRVAKKSMATFYEIGCLAAILVSQRKMGEKLVFFVLNFHNFEDDFKNNSSDTMSVHQKRLFFNYLP